MSLILTRKIHEAIIIGVNEISIRILSIDSRSNMVRLAIDAPPDVPVHREEIYNKAKENGTLYGY